MKLGPVGVKLIHEGGQTERYDKDKSPFNENANGQKVTKCL